MNYIFHVIFGILSYSYNRNTSREPAYSEKKTKLHNCAWLNVIMYRCTTKTRHYQFFPTRRCIKLCYHLIICISSKFVKASIRRIYSIQVMMLLNEVLHHPSTELACFVNLEAHLMPHSNCESLERLLCLALFQHNYAALC